MRKPQAVTRGPSWLQKAFDERDAYIESITPIQGKGITVTDSNSGRVINVMGSSSNPIVGVAWNSTDGAMVFTFADGATNSISFMECPPP